MFRVIKFDRLLQYTALTTVVLSMGIYVVLSMLFSKFPFHALITISSIISAMIVIMLSMPYFSRKIWAIYSFFDKSLFPDLNGTWKGVVVTEEGKNIEVRAVIRQTLLSTQIDMHGETAKSITLETTPAIEKGQKKLYYLYNSTPKNPSWPSYTGSTLFDIRHTKKNEEDIVIELSGTYYTNRKTIGRISLTQESTDPNKDVSFY